MQSCDHLSGSRAACLTKQGQAEEITSMCKGMGLCLLRTRSIHM